MTRRYQTRIAFAVAFSVAISATFSAQSRPQSRGATERDLRTAGAGERVEGDLLVKSGRGAFDAGRALAYGKAGLRPPTAMKILSRGDTAAQDQSVSSQRSRRPVPPSPSEQPRVVESAPDAFPPVGGFWTQLTHLPPVAVTNCLLLTDGTVMCNAEWFESSNQWYRLTPDSSGSYLNGTWTQLASMPASYMPLYFASAVLPDGRVIVEGGEYNCLNRMCQVTEQTQGAIYDPVSNTWTTVSPPPGWNDAGDAASIVLSDGTFMLADCCENKIALLNASTLTWTPTGTNQDGSTSEEGFTLLPDGTVLTVDAWLPGAALGSERFDPSTQTWSSAGSTVVNLVDNHAPGFSFELGPGVLRPDGTVIYFGANSAGAGHTAIFDTSTQTWSAGPDFLNGDDAADAPAALLPNGNVLVQASPGIFNTPSRWYEVNGSTLTQVASPAYLFPPSSYVGGMLVLPTGQVLQTEQSNDVEIYTPAGTYDASWAPIIASVPSSVTLGQTYTISGQQFNGLSQGAAYGDDAQSATNYPLVRITNRASGHVLYARTHDHSTMGVATGSATVATSFDVPAGAELGLSDIEVVANGIPSAKASITVEFAAVVTADSVTPAFGSGTSQTFALQYSDTAGATDLVATWAWFTGTSPSGSAANSCMTYYSRESNTLNLLDDTGTVWMSAPLGAGTLQNSQCAIGAGTAATSGNTLTLNLPMTFTTAFAGAKNVYMYGANAASANPSWQNRGTWTVISPDPVLSFVPDTIDFGSVGIGGHVDRTFTIQNIGGGTLTGNATTAAPFSIVSGGAFSLGSLASQALVVRFRPTAAGSVNGTVSGTSNTSNASASVTGTGTFQSLSIISGPNFGTISEGPLDGIPLSAIGGNGTYAWSVSAGSLPPGLAIRYDLPFFFQSDVSAALIGVATTPGTYTFTLRVTSGTATADQACILRVTGLMVKDGNQFNYLPDAYVGATYTYTLTALNAAGPVTWSATNGLPPGMTLSIEGILTGTPTTAGYFFIGLSVTDGTDTAFRGVTLPVNALNITTESVEGVLPNATPGVAYSTTLTATGGTAPYTFSGYVPSGLSLSPSGIISGTVYAFAAVGPSGFYVTVTDSQNISSSRNLSLDVIGVPAMLPSLSPYGNFDDCTIGMTCSRGIAVRSGGAAPFTWTAIGLPPGVSIRPGTGSTDTIIATAAWWGSWLAAGDAEIWGVPTATGTFNVTVTVKDAMGVTATNTFPLNVSALEQPSPLSSPMINVDYSQPIRVIGGALPYTGAQVAGQLPAGVTFDPATSLLSGTPRENGFFSTVFVFTDASNQTYRATENFWISGGGSNVNIYSSSDLWTFAVGSVYSNQLYACCGTSYNWSIVDGTLPAGLAFSSDGLLNGTATTAGTYTFLIKASDASNSANYGQRQFTLHVVSDPVLTITTGRTLPFGNMCTVYSQTLVATGGSRPLTWSLAFGSYLPPGLTLGPDGTLSGTPTGSGQYFFTVSVADSGGQTATGTFNLAIYPACGGPPLAQSQGPNFGTYSIGEVQIPLSATGGGGDGTYGWSIVAGSLPPGISLRTDKPFWFPVTASAGLIGVATTPGTYTFMLRLTSGTATVDQVCTLRVTGLTVKDGNQFNYLPDAYVGAAYTYTLTALNAAGPVTWSATNGLPAGMTLSTAGILTGTPTAAGYFFIGLSVTDGTDITFRSVTLPVNALNITTESVEGVLPNATPGAAYSTTLTATGGTAPYTFSGYVPSGLSLSPSGTISGTVDAFAAVGPSGLYVTVTDSQNIWSSKYLSLDVIGVPAALPSLSPYGNFDDCTIGMTCSRGIAVRSGGAAPFTWTATGLPPGVSIRPSTGSSNTMIAVAAWWGNLLEAGDAEIWGVPTTTGTFNVTVTVTDAMGVTATNTFPLNVSALVQPNPLSSPMINVDYSQTIRVIGGALPYTGAQVAGQLPAGLTFDPATSLLSGTPRENGFFSTVFVFTDASNQTYRATENFWISGGGSDINIYSNSDLGTLAVGSVYSNQLYACCATSYNWSMVDGTLPPGLTFSSDGLLSGTVTTAGTYTFLINASDASNSANYGQRQFTLHVVSGPLLSFYIPIVPVCHVGIPCSISLVATGGAGTLTWTVNPFNYLPPGLTLGSDGTLSGTPTASGQYIFMVTVADTGGQIATGSLNISIYPAIEAARIEITSPVEPIYDLGSAVLAQYTCVNAVTCSGDVLNGGALDTSTSGYHTFTVTATDAAGNTTVATVTYAVSLGSCVPPLAGMTAWLPGDGTADELIAQTFAVWTGTPAYATGRVGQGFAVSPGNSVSLPFQQPSSFTLETWVATPNAMQPEGTGIVSTGGANQLATSLQLELDGVGNYRLTVGDATLSVLIGPASSLFQHLAITFDGTIVTTYLNGQLVEADVWTGSPVLGLQTLTLGLARDGTQPFTGVIDEVQVFDRALSDDEVRQTFLAGAAGLCKNHPPVAAATATPNPAEATGPAGATVTLDGTGSSDPDHDTLTYTWTEGAIPLGTGSTRAVLFSLGSHTVTLTVDDGRGKSDAIAITVVVRDTTPPLLVAQSVVLAEAASPSGAVVFYSASAVDIVSGQVPINCVPASGQLFAIGVTAVQCSAVDAAGNILSGLSGTFHVQVQDTTPPVAQITSPSTDALLSGTSTAIVLQATDVIGIVRVTVNGVAASRTSGTAQSGTWRATVPIALPVPPGGALQFNAVVSDAAGNAGTASLVVDNDGIPSTLDRDGTSGADQSTVYSNDFNNGVTTGTLTRNGWTAVLSNVGTAGSVRAQISGAGSIAKIRACSGATKEVRLDVVGETADLTCNTSTGTITVRAVSAKPWIEVWKQQSNSTWLVAQVPTGATYQTGSPATASQDNTQPIDVRVVHLDKAGATTTVGGFRLAPGESVDVSVTPFGAGGDEQVHFNVLRGRVAVTVSGQTRTLSNGDRATMPIDLTPPKIVRPQ